MHVCDEFREKITEQIIDRRDLENNVDLQRELLVCNGCADFYLESRDLIDAMSAVHFDLPAEQWESMADRMRTRILTDHAAQSRPTWRSRLGLTGWTFRPYLPALAGALAMFLVAVGIYRLAVPLVEKTTQVASTPIPSVASVDTNALLDPVTVEFLEQSELLLRTVMKLEPRALEDLNEARKAAAAQLIELSQRKDAASESLPVVNVMDKYEMILREIRNLNTRPAAEDITDIQNRIEKNGLIARMQAFQPKVTVVDTDLGLDH